MVQRHIDSIGSVVGKREQVSMGHIRGTLTDPMGRDDDAWRIVGLRLYRCQRDQEHAHQNECSASTSDVHASNVGRLPFKTLGILSPLKVKNIGKQHGQNNACIALYVEAWGFGTEFTPSDLLVGWRTGVAAV